MENLDAGEDIGWNLVAAPPAQAAERVAEIVARSLIAKSGRRALEQQQRVHSRVVPGLTQALQSRVLAVEPQDVGVDDEERCRPQLAECVLHPATGLEQLDFGLELQKRPGPLTEMRLKRRAKMMEIDH